uniref:WIBG Mago-binding domain-containing protein n=1 Tax=Chromera velia CCMP2878 TaxID=1169474 RepID=A0A0G4F5B1_9ALVE|mmetsp:Transcript_45474/g.89571  ORF Transcript_45474/g.89571 Transcript_45474/m.89571 type:complete len:298 (-) Transcript_45474:115-1008(-)|eukprot:Cvel_2750.t1-p1 / transcript=Cvel_2750.t1 / gene=Cvel_2750 / organism=Chromera_velia_CCMP2878 / gene_product=Partner of Y14 and mago, putative / transcript_product=Partner of Y14 and mago, putative / location=Cvel_scaffold110:92498-95467(-) / protein_length=297 / sequence_SO=supercontig / SO=protein_coding / is_pseudo=false
MTAEGTQGEKYTTNEKGERVIASSKRPDGTMRKEIRVKDGFVPQEEQEAFKTAAGKAKSAFPPGYVPDEAPTAPAPKKKNKKKPSPEEQRTAAHTPEPSPGKANGGNIPAEPVPQPSAEPEKRLKNLKKKLGEIQALEDKIAKKDIDPIPEQLEKVARKAQVEEEIKDIERQIKKAQAPAKKEEPKPNPPAQQKAVKAAPQPAAPAAEPKKEKAPAKQEKAAAPAPPAAPANVEAPAPAAGGASAEAAKRIKNLNKKLKEIEELQKKIAGGYLASAEQEEKVARKAEIQKEIKSLGG